MKRVTLLLAVCLFALMLSACSVGSSKYSQKSESNTTAVSPSTSPAVQKTEFEQFESGLDELGIKYEKVTMGAELVGAQQGTKYKLSDGNIELYKFDISTDAYKAAVNNKAVTLQGFGAISAEFNNDMALIFDDEVSSKEDIQKLFSELT